MKFVDYYRVLGIKKSSTASEIRKAYLSLAKEHHPDRGGDETRMNRINEAYETLKEQKTRDLYDEIHRARYSPEAEMNSFFTDMMSDAGARHNLLSQATLHFRRFIVAAVVVLAVTGIFYSQTNSSLYLLLIVPAVYCCFQVIRSLHQVLLLTLRRPRQFYKNRLSARFQVTFLTISSVVLLLGVLIGGALAVSKLRSEKFQQTEVAGQVIFEDELEAINVSRKNYEGCVEEFSDIANQLNRVNQQLDTAFVAQDSASYNRYKKEREALVLTFESKRDECSNLQSLYNEKLEDYRKRTETE